MSLMNDSASSVLEVQEIFLHNITSSAVTGILMDFRLFRITGHASGVSVIIQGLDSDDAVPSGVTSASGATVLGEAATPLDRWRKWMEEMALTNDMATHGAVWDNAIPVWSNTQRKVKSIILRPSEGIHIKSLNALANTSVAGKIKFSVIA